MCEGTGRDDAHPVPSCPSSLVVTWDPYTIVAPSTGRTTPVT
jgi:hypothetical protein